MMFSISWSRFLIPAIIILTGYYVSILFIFYRRKKRKRSIGGFSVKDLASPLRDQPAKPVENGQQDMKEGVFPFVQQLMKQIDAVYKANDGQAVTKQELLTALQIEISQFPQLKDTPFMYAINNHMIAAAEIQYHLFLTANEVIRLWK